VTIFEPEVERVPERAPYPLHEVAPFEVQEIVVDCPGFIAVALAVTSILGARLPVYAVLSPSGLVYDVDPPGPVQVRVKLLAEVG
jgi:hypothetical protein